MLRSALRRLLPLLLLAALFGGAAHADSGKPVRLLVGFPPGGGTDAIARLLAEHMKDALGVAVIVENKPGAGGQLAAQALKAAPPDGSTLFVSHDHSISILPLVVRHPGYDPARDFVPVAGFASFVNAVALSSGAPAKTLPGHMAWAKARPGAQAAAVVGVPAPASVPEFLVKVLADTYRIDLVAAPYRGSAPMIADMLGSQILAGIGSVPDFIEHHRAGKLRIVAVLGGTRQAALPEVPTLAELGIAGFEELPYYAVFAPAGTPPAALDAAAAAIAEAIAKPAVQERLTAMGLAVEFMPAGALAARERAYARSWERVIKASGFKPQ